MITTKEYKEVFITSMIDSSDHRSVEVTIKNSSSPYNITIRCPDQIDHSSFFIIESRQETLIRIVEAFHEIRDEMIKTGLIKL